MIIELENFEKTLYTEAKQAFIKIINDLKDENIYSLALYNSGDTWGYLFPTVGTEKGLEEVAAKYKKYRFYRDRTIPSLKHYLRWSPCDSPRHEIYAETLPRTNKLLIPLSELIYKLYDEDKEELSNKLHDHLVSTTIQVLNRLQKDGVFDSLNRSTFTLNLLNGDQSDQERLERTKLLNPKNVYEKYESEI